MKSALISRPLSMPRAIRADATHGVLMKNRVEMHNNCG